jgi:long-chain fatty acid transport protein
MKMLPKTLALMIAVASGSAWSAGFALNEQSIKSMGMSQAGRASSALLMQPPCLVTLQA